MRLLCHCAVLAGLLAASASAVSEPACDGCTCLRLRVKQDISPFDVLVPHEANGSSASWAQSLVFEGLTQSGMGSVTPGLATSWSVTPFAAGTNYTFTVRSGV